MSGVARQRHPVGLAGARDGDVALDDVGEDGLGRALVGMAVAAAAGRVGEDVLPRLDALLAHDLGQVDGGAVAVDQVGGGPRAGPPPWTPLGTLNDPSSE